MSGTGLDWTGGCGNLVNHPSLLICKWTRFRLNFNKTRWMDRFSALRPPTTRHLLLLLHGTACHGLVERLVLIMVVSNFGDSRHTELKHVTGIVIVSIDQNTQ